MVLCVNFWQHRMSDKAPPKDDKPKDAVPADGKEAKVGCIASALRAALDFALAGR